MMDWLKVHSFLATWLGPIIGIVGLLLQQTRKQNRFDFRAFTIYLTFFVVMGVKLSNTLDLSKVTGVDIVWLMCFWNILWGDASLFGSKPQKPVDNSGPKPETPTRPQD